MSQLVALTQQLMTQDSTNGLKATQPHHKRGGLNASGGHIHEH